MAEETPVVVPFREKQGMRFFGIHWWRKTSPQRDWLENLQCIIREKNGGNHLKKHRTNVGKHVKIHLKLKVFS